MYFILLRSFIPHFDHHLQGLLRHTVGYLSNRLAVPLYLRPLQDKCVSGPSTVSECLCVYGPTVCVHGPAVCLLVLQFVDANMVFPEWATAWGYV